MPKNKTINPDNLLMNVKAFSFILNLNKLVTDVRKNHQKTDPVKIPTIKSTVSMKQLVVTSSPIIIELKNTIDIGLIIVRKHVVRYDLSKLV